MTDRITTRAARQDEAASLARSVARELSAAADFNDADDGMAADCHEKAAYEALRRLCENMGYFLQPMTQSQYDLGGTTGQRAFEEKHGL